MKRRLPVQTKKMSQLISSKRYQEKFVVEFFLETALVQQLQQAKLEHCYQRLL